MSSFITAFTGTSGAVDGVCIKYAMYDRTLRFSYLEPTWFQALYKCVEYYSVLHYYGSDMQRAADEPEFLARLPRRHPVRTMSSEKPGLTEIDYEAAKERFSVASMRVMDQGDSCRVECTFTNGSRRTEVLPGYIAMNLCGFLKACVDLSGLISSEPGGSA